MRASHTKLIRDMLPIYGGTRYQRGGGILSSIARFVLPTTKKFLSVRVAPTVVESILSKRQLPGQALLDKLTIKEKSVENV